MVLDKIPNTQLFTQRDVRETPASTATATSVGLTDGKYLVIDYHADMTAERKVTAGEGISFTDNGADSTFIIYGENATDTNKGICSLDLTDFTVTAGAVALKAAVVMSVDGDAGTATPAVHNIDILGGDGITTLGANNDITITNSNHAAVGLNTTHRGSNGSDHSKVTANETAIALNTTHRGSAGTDHSDVGLANTHRALTNEHINWTADQGATNIHAGNYTDTDTTYTANETNITLSGTEFQLKNKTSYWSCPGENFTAGTATAYSYSDGNLVAGATLFARAPVFLPHGAIITGVAVYGSEADETWSLYRQDTDIDGAGDILATANINTEDTSISNATVDNSNEKYFLVTSSIDNTDEIYGARIKYTTDYV